MIFFKIRERIASCPPFDMVFDLKRSGLIEKVTPIVRKNSFRDENDLTDKWYYAIFLEVLGPV